MHAVVFEVDLRDGWRSTVDDELDYIVGTLSAEPGFVRGTWTGNGTRGLAIIVFEAEETAQNIVDNAELPPDAGASLRSAEVHEVLRVA